MIDIQRILCPVDFSEFSRHALARAVVIARRQVAAVTVLHVVPWQVPVIVSQFAAPAAVPQMLTNAERDSVRRDLEDFVAPYRTDDVPITTLLIEASSVHAEIVAQAAHLHANLVVMGTHGRTGFQRLLLGSVTERVLRTIPQPVLTVGAHDTQGDAAPLFRRVLCAVDFSECSIAALNYAVAITDPYAHLSAVHVIEWTPTGYDPLIGPAMTFDAYRQEAERAGRERLHKLVLPMTRRGRGIEEFVKFGKPYHEILRLADEERYDLIVLGIHGHNPIDRMLFGTTTEPVVRRAPCPVLTVRAEAHHGVAAA
jgi:nucleotide-binding universal stress UspA family protein